MALNREAEVYRSLLHDLLGVNEINAGKFAVIHGDHARGIFDTYDEALKFGYENFGLAPFLVKKIERNETVMYFSRSLG